LELTQTSPGPPPAAGAAEVEAPLIRLRPATVGGVPALELASGVAAALAMWVLLSRLLLGLLLSLPSLVAFADAIAALLRFLACLAIPPWPRQAPRPVFADIVPSLHITPCEVAVAPMVDCCAPTGGAIRHATAIDAAATR